MPRVTSRPRKPKHVAVPMLVNNGRTLVLRDKARLKHHTDHVKPKIKDLRGGEILAFIESGEQFVRKGEVVSTTSTEIFLKVIERAHQGGKWFDITHDYRITAAAVIGTWEEYTRRVHVVDRLTGGRVYGLGYPTDGTGYPRDIYTASGDPSVPLV